ncbi:MAG: ATP synthase F1 subunit gamma [Candidatus Sungiibacteriota bacterium]
MPSTKSIKQRIKSVKNTSQITKAMEVVSATKMRKSQAFALGARSYAVAGLEMAQNLLARTPINQLPPLLTPREIKTSCLLVVTSDKGLAGAFNGNVLKKAEAQIAQYMVLRRPYILITVGKKAKEYFERRGSTPVKSFWGYGDYSTITETQEVADAVLAGFLDGSWDEVHAAYMNFRSTLVQESVIKKILPATKEGIEDAVASILPERGRFANLQPTTYNLQPRYQYEYKFEPSAAEILQALVPQLIKMHIHHIILESNASEHSARMVAMKSASDNARDLITDLTLVYNNARQASITRELSEITAGAEALEG